MKIKYQCGYCCDVFDTEGECIKHETEECDDNSAVRSCETCKHSKEDVGGTNAVYYSCDGGHKETSNRSWRKHCEYWVWDEGYAH